MHHESRGAQYGNGHLRALYSGFLWHVINCDVNEHMHVVLSPEMILVRSLMKFVLLGPKLLLVMGGVKLGN